MKKIIYTLTFLYLFAFTVKTPLNAQEITGEYTASDTSEYIELDTEEYTARPADPDNVFDDISDASPVTAPLAIVSVCDFDFGEGSISSSRQFYDIKTDKPNIQVADLRQTPSGWKLDACVSPFTGSGGQETLSGSSIRIRNGRINSVTPLSYSPQADTDIVLTTDGSPARIITAEPGTGQGLWVDRLYPESSANGSYVQLEVPAGIASAGRHTATITWILSNTP